MPSVKSLFTEFDAGSINEVAQVFLVLADMLILAHSYTSKLPNSNREGGILDLSLYIKKHQTKTVMLEHRAEEKRHFQWLHLLAVKEYEEKIKAQRVSSKIQ